MWYKWYYSMSLVSCIINPLSISTTLSIDLGFINELPKGNSPGY